VGIPIMMHGEGVKITEDVIPDVTKQPDVMQAAAEAGILLARRLTEGHNRAKVTQAVQQKMMEMMKSTA
jgi:hypothetical protein